MVESQQLDDSRDFTIKHIEDGDPCDGVVCEPKCFGEDLHSTICLDGKCVQGDMIEADAEQCAGVTPSTGTLWLIVGVLGLAIWSFMRR